ncbi:hypothetical protein V8F06_009022 [Rhypophila decipiens]
MTKQAQNHPYAAVNTNLKFVNTIDGRRPLASQDPNTSSVAAVAGAVSPAPPWKQQPLQALPVPGALVGTGGGPGAPGPGPGPSIGSTSADSAMVPAQQAQPYPRHDRNGGRPAARRRHQDHHRRHRRRPSRNHVGGGGSTTLRYMHDQTTNIHDRLSGCQPGGPPEVEWEEAMRLGLDRLTEIIDHPRTSYGYDDGDAFTDSDSARGLNFDQAGYLYEEYGYYQYP